MAGDPADLGTRLERLLSLGEELAQLGTWELDLRSGEWLWSEQLYRIFGLEPEPEAGGPALESILDAVHPEDRLRMEALLGSVSEPSAVAEEGISVEVRILQPNEAVRALRAHGRVERDVAGQPVRWVGVAQDITDQRLLERQLHARHVVSESLREWDGLEEGLMDLLERVATALEYEMASLWLWDDQHDVLTCRAFWSAPDVDPGHFEVAKRSLTYRPGKGELGVAWETGEPVVIPDAASDPIFQPRAETVMRGVRSGLAFPAVAPDGPVAVLSLYSLEHRLPSESIKRTLTAIGFELGGFLARRRGELGPQPLSDRELQVLRLAAEGNTGPEIAERLFVSPLTVKTHFQNIYEKLGVSDRAAAVALALRTGLIR
jgi:DNA-binding CsgD family transcriptional regulator